MLSIDAWLDEKPYREVYDGVIHEKVSPQNAHGKVALRVGRLLEDWAGRRGDVSVELRVYLAPGTTLVPDVAFISGARLAPLSNEKREKPPFAPDIVAEIRSPDDREANVRRIRQFIDCNLGRDDLTAARVAVELNLSPRYINKVLAAEGTSLIRHLWHRRITMAAEQLREPRLARRSISAIAFSLGFKNLSHFSDLFRRTYGVSPTEYRGQHPR